MDPRALEDLRRRPEAADPRADGLLVPPGEGEVHGPVLVGVPYDGGVPTRPGARWGPRALREALARLTPFDGQRSLAPLTDLGDLEVPFLNNAAAHATIEEAARRLFAGRVFPLFVGGDHGLTGSVLRGLAGARPDLRLALVSFDAHLDVRPFEEGRAISSGSPIRRVIESGAVAPERVAILGVRPYANAEAHWRWAEEQGIHLVPIEALVRDGVAAAVAAAARRVRAEADAVYLTIDLDVADISVAPGVSAPGVGGLTTRELLEAIGQMALEPTLIGADIVELAPAYDPDGRTALLAARLLLELLAAR